jgi:SAM-dependent methyltransferase
MLKPILLKIYRKIFQAKNSLPTFESQFNLFKKLDIDKRLIVRKEDWYPCLEDNTNETNFDAHYVYHPAWAARIVRKINPAKHIDISSTLHFCSILSAFIPVDFYDFRPAKLNLGNLKSLKGDLMNLDFEDNSIHSISCMHTIEHIGLGRYGDPIDPDGDLKAINELKRVCAKDGNLLIVVPVGIPKVAFNAHRIYKPSSIINYMEGFSLKEFALVTDSNDFIMSAELDLASKQHYGCGCFWFVKN